MQDEEKVFRGVNRYIDFNNGQELLHYTDCYDTPVSAKRVATMRRRKRIGYDFDKVNRVHTKFYEFSDTWIETPIGWAVV